MKTIRLLEIEQPIGSLYFGKISSTDLNKVAKIGRISEGEGPQRDVYTKKVTKIESFCKKEDGTTVFPTPIIVNIKCDDSVVIHDTDDGCLLKYDENKAIFWVIDGQHRLLGIKKANVTIDLPLIVLFDLSAQDEAYIFTTINNNQTKVDKSIIYELFKLSDDRSVIKVCHDIAVIMNESEDSPFYSKLKMLGKKRNEGETLSQAAFIDSISPLFPKDDDKPENVSKNSAVFADFYFKNNDATIVKILMNYFSAVKQVFNVEWNDSKFNLTKTTGMGGLCLFFPSIYKRGLEDADLSKEYFIHIFSKIKTGFERNKLSFTSDCFPAGKGGQNELAAKLNALSV